MHAPTTFLRPEIPAQLPNSYSIQNRLKLTHRSKSKQSDQTRHGNVQDCIGKIIVHGSLIYQYIWRASDLPTFGELMMEAATRKTEICCWRNKWLWPEFWGRCWPERWGNAASLQGISFCTGHELPLGWSSMCLLKIQEPECSSELQRWLWALEQTTWHQQCWPHA